jgi:hypothetical protein
MRLTSMLEAQEQRHSKIPDDVGDDPEPAVEQPAAARAG